MILAPRTRDTQRSNGWKEVESEGSRCRPPRKGQDLCFFPPPTLTVLSQMINMEPGYGGPDAVMGSSFQSEGPKGTPNDKRQSRTRF